MTYLGHYVSTMLFVMTSCDLNIDLTQKSIFTKVVDLSMNYQMPFVVCRYSIRVFFFRPDGGPKIPLPDSDSFRARPEQG